MKLDKILLIVLLITIPLTIILTPYRFLIFNEGFYQKQFKINNVYSRFPDADNIMHNITVYFKGKQELNVDIFTKNEKSHLNDVKYLIDDMIAVYYILVIINGLIFYYIIRNGKTKTLLRIIIISGLIIIVVSLFLYFFRNSFSDLFTSFHKIFFPQGNWEFPLSSNLIGLFPKTFFYNTFYSTVIFSVIISLFFIFLSIFLSSLLRRKRK